MSDINECLGDPCDENAKCSNNLGSFECKCNSGYSGNGFSCTGIFHLIKHFDVVKRRKKCVISVKKEITEMYISV